MVSIAWHYQRIDFNLICVNWFVSDRSALEYFNERALENEDFAVNFALLFTSCHFDGLREHLQSSDGNSIFRAQILNMLQQNYSSELFVADSFSRVNFEL